MLVLFCADGFSPLLNKGNEFIRDVFELGPPMLVDSATMKAMKISRFERVCVHAQVVETLPLSFSIIPLCEKALKSYHLTF